MKLPSGSKLELASICPPSVVLPGVDSTSSHAARGTAFHDFLKDVNLEGIPGALLKAPEEHREALAALDFERLPLDPAQYAAEVSFAYDVTSGKAREVGRGLTREQARGLCLPGEMMGTADVVSLGGDAVLVLDYKTGWTDYGPTKANWQLGFYALCAARAYGQDSARVGIVRLREDGSNYFDMADLDFFDLEDIAFRLSAVVERVKDAAAALANDTALQLRSGGHCKRCPAMGQCPAMTQLAREMGRDGLVMPVLTDASAPVFYERLKAAQAVVEHIETALEVWAAEHPVTLLNGKIYGRHKLPRDQFVPEIALDIMRTEFGEDFVTRAVDITPRITKEGIKKALRVLAQHQRGLKVEPTLRGLQDRLRLVGGLTTKFTYPVMVYKPKPEDDDVANGSAGDEASVGANAPH
jgi:hypothetical protein